MKNFTVAIFKTKYLLVLPFLITGYQLIIESGIFRDQTVEKIHAQDLKAVQLLTKYFFYRDWALPQLGQHPFAYCPEKRCFAFQPNYWRNIPNEKSDGIR